MTTYHLLISPSLGCRLSGRVKNGMGGEGVVYQDKTVDRGDDKRQGSRPEPRSQEVPQVSPKSLLLWVPLHQSCLGSVVPRTLKVGVPLSSFPT